MSPTPAQSNLVIAADRLYVSAEERRRFIAATRTYGRTDVGTFAATLAYTGCRRSQALAVRAVDVDLKERTIGEPAARRSSETRTAATSDGAHRRSAHHRRRSRSPFMMEDNTMVEDT